VLVGRSVPRFRDVAPCSLVLTQFWRSLQRSKTRVSVLTWRWRQQVVRRTRVHGVTSQKAVTLITFCFFPPTRHISSTAVTSLLRCASHLLSQRLYALCHSYTSEILYIRFTTIHFIHLVHHRHHKHPQRTLFCIGWTVIRSPLLPVTSILMLSYLFIGLAANILPCRLAHRLSDRLACSGFSIQRSRFPHCPWAFAEGLLVARAGREELEHWNWKSLSFKLEQNARPCHEFKSRLV
jgi:hypothetical protein